MDIVPIQQLFYDVFGVYDLAHIFIVFGSFLLSASIAGRIFFDSFLDMPSWILSVIIIIFTNSAGLVSYGFFYNLIDGLPYGTLEINSLHFLSFFVAFLLAVGIVCFTAKVFIVNCFLAILVVTTFSFGGAYLGRTVIVKFYELQNNIYDGLETDYQELPR